MKETLLGKGRISGGLSAALAEGYSCEPPTPSARLDNVMADLVDSSSVMTNTPTPSAEIPSSFLRNELGNMHMNQNDHTRDPLLFPEASVPANDCILPLVEPARTDATTIVHKTFRGADKPSLLPSHSMLCDCCFEPIAFSTYPNVNYASGNSREEEVVVSCSTHQHYFCSNCIFRFVNEWVFGASVMVQARVTTNCRMRDGTPGTIALPCISCEGNRNCCPGYIIDVDPIRNGTSAHLLKFYVHKLKQLSLTYFDYVTIRLNVVRQTYRPVSWRSPGAPARLQASPSSRGVTQQELDAYHHAEESLTHAVVRRCPKCSTGFITEVGGCNKVQCPCCHNWMCYSCRQTVLEVDDDDDEKAQNHLQHYCTCRPLSYSSARLCRRCKKCRYVSRSDKAAEDKERLEKIANGVANYIWEKSLMRVPNIAPNRDCGISAVKMPTSAAAISKPEIRLNLSRLLYDPSQC